MTLLYHELKAAGVETANHESDLYFPKTEQTAAILLKHKPEADIAQTFRHSTLNTIWFDVPFAFVPWWEACRTAQVYGNARVYGDWWEACRTAITELQSLVQHIEP